MKSCVIACSFAFAVLMPNSASADYIVIEAFARGNIPSEQTDKKSYGYPAEWAAAGQVASVHAHAGKDDWDPPLTESDATALFDQSDPTNAVLRSKLVTRRAYGGRYHNFASASSAFSLRYSMKIENLTATAVNVNFANDLHGLFANIGFGAPAQARAYEQVAISDLTTVGGTTGSVTVDWASGATSTDLWASFLHPALLHDDFYGDVDGFELNSPIEYYGSRLVAGGASVVSTVNYYLFLTTNIWQNDGLALVDFSNTGYLKVTATDPITGADRSADIRVTLPAVPEPQSWALMLAGGGMLAWLRRRRQGSLLATTGTSVNSSIPSPKGPVTNGTTLNQ